MIALDAAKQGISPNWPKPEQRSVRVWVTEWEGNLESRKLQRDSDILYTPMVASYRLTSET